MSSKHLSPKTRKYDKTLFTLCAAVISLGMILLGFVLSTYGQLSEPKIVPFSTSDTFRVYDAYNNFSTIQYFRTAIITELSTKTKHIAELHTMLYPSWLYVKSLTHLQPQQLRNHTQIQSDDDIITSVQLDLIIFCESKSCETIPIGCYPLKHLQDIHESMNNFEFKIMYSSCFYYALDDEYEKRALAKGYRFLASLLFLTEEPCTSIIKYYDYIIRTDADVLITPLSLLWIPQSYDQQNNMIPLDAAFGSSFMGTEVTFKNLESVSKKLKLKHAGLHGMQSSWYVKSEIFVELIELAVDLTVYFYTQEFNDTYKGKWANWFRGVSSLYGSNLAINHVLFDRMIAYKKRYNIDINDWKTKKMDVSGNPLITKTVQMHLISPKHSLVTKLARIRKKEDLVNLCRKNVSVTKKDMRRKKFGAQLTFEPIMDATNAMDYAVSVVGKSLRSACSTFMIQISETAPIVTQKKILKNKLNNGTLTSYHDRKSNGSNTTKLSNQNYTVDPGVNRTSDLL